jgi:hypothetical protein
VVFPQGSKPQHALFDEEVQSIFEESAYVSASIVVIKVIIPRERENDWHRATRRTPLVFDPAKKHRERVDLIIVAPGRKRE